MLKVKNFRIKHHYDILCWWLKQREAYIPSVTELPQYGFMSFISNKPVATAFLRRVEGGYAQLDGLVSNPEASSEDRHIAIDAVVNAVKQKCKELGITQLIAFTSDKSTFKRSATHGFVSRDDHKLIVLSI